MRKNFYYAILLVGLSTTAYKAQVQRGVGINTDQPAATLDIKATTTDNTMPDAILVPRMTATQLNDKNASYVTAQDGALVFVTAGTGTAGTKTALVTGKGFYYFDSAAASNVGRWTAVGGGATTPLTSMSVRTTNNSSITDTDINNMIIVTANIVFDLSTLTKTNGKTITFLDNNTAGTAFSVIGASAGSYTTSQGLGTGLSYVCDGNAWYSYNAF